MDLSNIVVYQASGEIIYVILIAIGIIVSIVKSINEAKEKKQEPPIITSIDDDFIYSDEIDDISFDNKIPDIPKIPTIDSKADIKSEDKKDVYEVKQSDEDNNFDFDARKAIIYSEILKRPDY